MSTLFTVTTSTLAAMNPTAAVMAFRDLLWCQARRQGVPLDLIQISLDITKPDGGIDAAVIGASLAPPDDLLLAGNTHYQIKAGGSARPWQKSWLRKELFGNSNAGVKGENLGPAVRRCLETGGAYVLVCFGVDPTTEDTAKACETLRLLFRTCGFPDARVKVLGQTTLVGLISTFPSLCLRLAGREDLQFQSLASWAMNGDMGEALHLAPAQEEFVATIRDALRNCTADHVRVIGEPGLGKTRLILKALSAPDLAPTVIYLRQAEDLEGSGLLNQLLRPDNNLFVILVLDDCSARQRTDLWNVLMRRTDRCRLITVDHGPEESASDRLQILTCPPLPAEQIAAILTEYVEPTFEAKRWADFCGGSPRVAHAVGANLRRNPSDVLKSPAHVDIWGRFIAGTDHPGSPEVVRRTLVLRYMALFVRFGFEAPVHEEARFICQLAAQADPGLTWPIFESIVVQLQQRRILQGKTTLFLVPKALHVYLWLQFWEYHGRSVDLKALLKSLPSSMLHWFGEMLRYAHVSDVARAAVTGLLSPNGPMADEAFVASEPGYWLLSTLAEAAPEETLACIQRTLGTWDRQRLLAFAVPRQHIVWALEKLAVWSGTFEGAATVLLRLAAAENANYTNNATGTFADLFSLAYGALAPTETPPAQRWPILATALASTVPEERAVGLRACQSALRVDNSFKIVGPEHQGLRPVAKLWTPKLWGEIFDGYRAVWDLLRRSSAQWTDEERRAVANVLMEGAFGLLEIEPLSSMVMDTLEKLAAEPPTDLKQLVELIFRSLRWHKELPPETRKRLEDLNTRLAGTTFASHLRRYVLLASWDEQRDEAGEHTDAVVTRIRVLADEAKARPDLLLPLLPELSAADHPNIYNFGWELAQRDPAHSWFVAIADSAKRSKPPASLQLLGGYLRGVRSLNSEAGEQQILKLLGHKTFQHRAGELLARAGVAARPLSQMRRLFTAGKVAAGQFRHVVYGMEIQALDEPVVTSLVSALVDEGSLDAIAAALELMNTYYCRDKHQKPLPKPLTRQVLGRHFLAERSANTMIQYHWGLVALQYSRQYPKERPKLFASALKLCRGWDFAIHMDNQVRSAVDQIVRDDPAGAWRVLTKELKDTDGHDHRNGAWNWLRYRRGHGYGSSSTALTLFPLELILGWIEKNPQQRTPLLIRVVPKNLDPEGPARLAREIVDRYGDIPDVVKGLWDPFLSDSWSGSESEHNRKIRTDAQLWLQKETSPNVRKWLVGYIRWLTERIAKAHIREEREH